MVTMKLPTYMLRCIDNMKPTFILLVFSSIFFGCSEVDKIDLEIANIDSGTIEFKDVDTGERLLKKSISSDNQVSFLETMIGERNLKVTVSSEDETKVFSAVIPKKFSGERVNINAITTLASCFYDADGSESSGEDKINRISSVIENHFGIENFLSTKPDSDLKNIRALSNESRYGLIVASFETFAQEYGDDVSTKDVLDALCDDFTKEKELNGIGSDGNIRLGNLRLYDQTLKAFFAGHMYRFVREKAENINDADARLLVNGISKSDPTDLFDSDIANFTFETETPGDPAFTDALLWGPAIVSAAFNIEDDTSYSVQISAEVYFIDTDRTYPVPNEIEGEDIFVLEYEYPTPEDAASEAILRIYAVDVFGNVATFEYPS